MTMETVKSGSRGNDVELLQLALTRSGYYSDNIDGVFGPRTQNAVRRFQSSFGLKPDGIVGEKTWFALNPFIFGYFTTKIRNGDTFYRLAKQYDTTVTAIAEANPSLEENSLQVGETIVIPYGFDLVPVNVHYTSKLVTIITEGLKKRYPFITTKDIGNSVMGKNITSFEIGTGTQEVFYNGAHHANEWITTTLLMKFTENYLKAYINNGTIQGRNIRQLYEKTKLCIVPLVNPDGIDLVNGALGSQDPYYNDAIKIAKAYPMVRFPDGWKANVAGTDLNLNYPAGWETARKIKFEQGYVSPAPRDYVGTAPLSAPESRAVFDYTKQQNFKLILAYHTQGQVIYWKYRDIEPAGGYEIGRALAQASGYSLDDVPDESGNAGYKDWFILNYERPGYTIEAGLGVNPLPLSQFGTIYNDNVGILTVALEKAIEI